MTFNSNLRQYGLRVTPINVSLHAGHNPRTLHRLMSSFRRAMAAKGMCLAFRCGFALLLPRGRQSAQKARHIALAWLTDQTEVREITISEPVELIRILRYQCKVMDEFDQVITLQDSPQFHIYLARIAQGLLLQATFRWQRFEEHARVVE